MQDSWIDEARARMREFFANATPNEIGELFDEAGYDVYAQGPTIDEARYVAPDKVEATYTEVTPSVQVNVYMNYVGAQKASVIYVTTENLS